MMSARRGLCIIISNEHFTPKSNFKRRVGAQVDTEMLRTAFVKLGFEVRQRHDVTAMVAQQLLVDAAAVDHSKYDCFLLAVMTHGDAGNVFFGIDGRHFTLAELMAPIKRCPTLAGKPKICIIQASRGSQIDDGIEVDSSDDKNIHIPLEADQLVVHSTSEGHFSWRSSQQGSWFIRALSDELGKSLSSSTDDVDFAQVLTNVTRTVAYDYQSRAVPAELNAKKQVPSLYSTLTKEIVFPNTASSR